MLPRPRLLETGQILPSPRLRSLMETGQSVKPQALPTHRLKLLLETGQLMFSVVHLVLL